MIGYLYRYSSKAFNEQFMNEGVIRIGTLYDFRNSEHKRGIADPSEGKKTVSYFVEDCKAADEIPGQPSKSLRALNELGNITLEGGQVTGVRLVRELISANYYIHCSSHKLSRTVMKEFDGAETCIEIQNPQGFYRHATHSLNEITPVKFEGVYIIQYMDRNEEWNGVDYGIDGCLIKEFEFKGQYELRAIWSPLNNAEIKPELIRNMNLTKHCRRVL